MKYVIIDIETTGLDIKYSSVIEVGAIKIDNEKIVDNFSSFVQYNKELPIEIKTLTGIDEKDLRGAEEAELVIKKIKSFIGDYPVVAHNGYNFDFPLLERYGLKIKQKHDSMEFAFFVLPTYELGYSVKALAQKYNLGKEEHRALSDCKMEFEILKKLQSEYKKKSKKKQDILNYSAHKINWWWSDFLTGAGQYFESISEFISVYNSYRKEDIDQGQIDLEYEKINIDEVVKHFIVEKENDDNTSYSEDRPEQKEMATIITNSFNNHNHAVIEAGTGVGKSKAYLVPSAIFALKNGIPIIISTHTKVLQDQLLSKEIPHINKLINRDLRVAVLKGKKNYVCIEKFDDFSKMIGPELFERALYENTRYGIKYTRQLSYILLLSWIIDTDRGDWDELPYWLTERIPHVAEIEIRNLDEMCNIGSCEHFDENRCFLAKAKLKAKDSDIVIVNHALTLSEIRPINIKKEKKNIRK